MKARPTSWAVRLKADTTADIAWPVSVTMFGMTLTAMMLIVAGFVVGTSNPPLSPHLPTPLERGTLPTSGRPIIDAGLGACSTTFVVTDGAGEPIASANIRMSMRYGLMGLRRKELALGTGADGRARVNGLPDVASQLLYDIGKGRTSTQIQHDLGRACHGRYDITLK